MNPSRKFAAVLLAILAGTAAIAFTVHAQPSQPQIPMPSQQPIAPLSNLNHNLILLDPAHGASDPGATLGDHVLEKDVTLALANRLRAALTAAGFTVISTRDSDPANPLTTDQRAEIANHTHAVACVVLHATTTGSGVHVYTSTLLPAAVDEDQDSGSPPSFVPVPWDTAQAAAVSQSLRLAADLSTALSQGSLPLLVGKAAIRPLDNLTCPAVAIELAPLRTAGGDATAVTNAEYQQRVVAALTAALQTWRGHADPLALSAPTSAEDTARAKAMAAAEAVGRTADGTRSAVQSQKGSQ